MTEPAAIGPTPPTAWLDGVRFRQDHDGPSPEAVYHQKGNILTGDFAGHDITHGSLVGHVLDGGDLDFVYWMRRTTGELITGHCRSKLRMRPDGRISVEETWTRLYPGPTSSGVSYLISTAPVPMPR